MPAISWALSGASASGNWSTGANWIGGVAPISTDSAVFSQDITADATVSLTANTVIAGLSFNDTIASNLWKIAGAFTLSLSAGTITTTTNAEIASAVIGSGAITKAGNATLTLSGGGTNSGTWAINAGTLAITTAAMTGGGAISVNNNAALTVSANIAKPVAVVNTATATLNANTGNLTIAGNNNVTLGAGTSSGTLTNIIGNAAGATVLTVPSGRIITTTVGVTNVGNAVAGSAVAVYLAGQINNTAGSGFNAVFGGLADYVYIKGSGTGQIAGVSGSNHMFGLDRYTSPFNTINGSYTVIDGSDTFKLATFRTTQFGGNGTSAALAKGPTVVTLEGGAHTATNTGDNGFWAIGSSLNFSNSVTLKGASTTYTLTNYDNNAPNDAVFLIAVSANATASLNLMSGAAFTLTGSFLRLNTNLAAFGQHLGKAFINFRGGVLRFNANITNDNAGGSTQFRLFAPTGGATNQISGGAVAGVTSTLPAPIVEATGYGIASVAMGSIGADYIGAPTVQITGGSGDGATARAVWNSVTRQIDSIEITCPGSGYQLGDSISVVLGGPTVANGGCSALATATVSDANLASNTAGQGIEKIEAGGIALTATNANTGTYTVTAGTLKIGNAAAAGTLGAVVAGIDTGAASIAASATLNFNRTDARTYSGTITGASSATLSRTGSTAPTALNSYAAKLTGTNTNYQGIVSIAAANVIEAAGTKALGDGVGGITILSTGALHLSGGFTATANKPITASGTGVATTGAIKNVSGNNTLGGTLTLGAALSIGSDADTLTLSNSGNTTLSATNTMSFVGAGDVDFSPTLIGTGGTVTKTSGAGAAILRGTNTYTGATTASAGYLGYATQIVNSTNGSFGFATSNIAVAESAGLRYYGTGNVAFSRGIQFTGATAGATYKLESNGAGAVTHSGALSYATTSVAKTLQLGGTGTAANTVSTAITNNVGANAVSVIKADTGKWIFSSTGNTYTGNTTVNAGTLVASSPTGAARFGASNTVTVNANGTIQTLTGTTQQGKHSYNNLTFAGGKIRIGG